MNNLPATAMKLKEIENTQNQDAVCKQVKKYCQSAWPCLSNLKGLVKSFTKIRQELSVNNGLLLRGNRLVIPNSLQSEILEKLHSGHQGLTKCRLRAKQSVWWPNIRQHIEEKVSKCPVCCKYRIQPAEPLIPSQFPERPWQKVGTDLFEWKKSNYLLVVDYFSRFIEVSKLSSTSSEAVIEHLKSIFSRHGIPETVMSDNGPQYSAAIFGAFAIQYGFTHTTSSPRYPQANGAAERAVRTVKELLVKNKDPYLAMLAYRSTPLENGYSPAELLMGRRIRTTIPVITKQLFQSCPRNPYSDKRRKI